MSIFSTDIEGAERTGRDGCIRIEEEIEVSLAMSIVLATNKSRKKRLELDGGSEKEVGKLPVSSLEAPATTNEVTIGAFLGDEGAARIVGRVNWAEAKVR